MKEKKIAREERNQEKLANGDWVMAEFYATWCPHCQRMKPVVEEFKKLMEGTLEVVLVDIDQEPALTDFRRSNPACRSRHIQTGEES